MLEDKILVFKCRQGSPEALCRLYEKYKDYLLTLAKALLTEKSDAEDVVHDVFVSFAQKADQFRFTGSLRAYLAACVRNLAIDKLRARKNTLDSSRLPVPKISDPQRLAMESEQLNRLRLAIAQLPYDQRETVVLYLKGALTFKQIANLQSASVNTVKGRYRYGLDKLRTLLNSEIEL